jgi:hypothetical protein
MLILAFILPLELVTVVFLGFDNFQSFGEVRSKKQNLALSRLSARLSAENGYQLRI